MNTIPPRPTLQVDCTAVRNNVHRLRQRLGEETEIMAVIKASAYGTEASGLARVLQQAGVGAFAVADLAEARELRAAGVLGTLLIFHLFPWELSEATQLGCDICFNDPSLLGPLMEVADRRAQEVRVHLHVDTGMGRLACSPDDALPLARKIDAHPYMNLSGMMTHLASAEDPDHDAFTLLQQERFLSILKELRASGIRPLWTHACNSAGAIRFPEHPFNLARIGLALYGVPTSSAVKSAFPLEPALSLQAPVIALRNLAAGTTVGYGSRYQVPKNGAQIATLAIGYHDGLPRAYYTKGQVHLKHQQVPLAGMISMDYTTIDVSSLPDLQLGETAQIFGQGLPLEQVAAWAGVIPHELLARLGPRVQRLLV